MPSDYNLLFAGNLENGDPSLDWNGAGGGTYQSASMKTQYKFDYCIPLKVGSSIFDYNEYELTNGGKNGDLYCAANKVAGAGWRPNQGASFYNKKVKPASCA